MTNRRWTVGLVALMLLAALTACGGQAQETASPAAATDPPAAVQTAAPTPEATSEPTEAPTPLTPEEVYQQIAAVGDFPGMVEMADPYLLDNIGIKPEQYTAAVYYLVEQGTDPDEIIIVAAADDAAAGEIQNRLEQWLTRRIEGAQSYLVENLPILEAGVVRRDGNTVSLLVAKNIDAVLEAYDALADRLP